MRTIQKLISGIHKLRWTLYNIGFVERRINSIDDLDISAETVHWLDTGGYKGGWMADPFILTADPESVTVLAEEMYGQRGRIVRLSVDRRGYKLKQVTPVLELDTHLSFPNFIKDTDGTLYLYPENYQGGALRLYPYDAETNVIGAPVKVIDRPLVDSQIVEIDGAYYVFGIKFDDDKRKMNSTAYVYRAPSLLGPYQQLQTLVSEGMQQRGAGAIIKVDGVIVRPTQKCDSRYGEGTILKRLDLNDGVFTETPLTTIAPHPGTKWAMARHTFNTYEDLCVVDGLDYLYPTFNRIFGPLLNKISPTEE